VKTVILSPGAFPDLKRPKVLYLGLESNDDLIGLKEKVDECLGEIGFPGEKRDFVPHLTIGRVKRRPELPDVLPQIEQIPFGLESVTLCKSELRKSGSLHIPLKYFKL